MFSKHELTRFGNYTELLQAEKKAAESQPFTAASFAKLMTETGEAIQEGNKGSLLEAIDAVKLAYYHLTKTYALISAVWYLQDGDFYSPAISDKISEMRMPYDSTWKGFLEKLDEIGDVRSERAWFVLWIPLSPYPDVKAQYLFAFHLMFLRCA